MKIQPECIPCLLNRLLYESKLATDDIKLQSKAILDAIKTLVDVYSPSKCSAQIATEVHRALYKATGNPDPYRELKERSNKVALSIIPKVERIVKESKDPLKTSMICSIIGNIMDFGIEGGSDSPEKLADVFDMYLSEGLGHDDYNELKNILSDAKKVILITDNCGEIVFDKVLCRELKQFNPKIHLTLVVRGAPILSDATEEDAKKLGFEEVVDNIMTTGAFAVGLDIKNIPKRLDRELRDSDIIISKGMANYEVLSETNYRPIAYLLRTKCTAIARSMKLPLQINAIKLYKG